MILLGRQRLPRQDIDAAFLDAGIKPNIKVEAHSVSTACALVASGIGITLVNELMARDYIHRPVKVVPVVETLMHRFAFAFSANIPCTKAAQQFMDMCASKLNASYG